MLTIGLWVPAYNIAGANATQAILNTHHMRVSSFPQAVPYRFLLGVKMLMLKIQLTPAYLMLKPCTHMAQIFYTVYVSHHVKITKPLFY